MRCPFCSSRDTRVLDKRDADEVAMTRRRRERQQFSRDKLRASIQTACTKRPISAETIERIVDQIESALRKRDGLEVQSSVVGDHVIERLRKLDQVAYI